MFKKLHGVKRTKQYTNNILHYKGSRFLFSFNVNVYLIIELQREKTKGKTATLLNGLEDFFLVVL